MRNYYVLHRHIEDRVERASRPLKAVRRSSSLIRRRRPCGRGALRSGVGSGRSGRTAAAFSVVALLLLIAVLAGYVLYNRAVNDAVYNAATAKDAPREVPATGQPLPQVPTWRLVGQIKTDMQDPRGIALGPTGDLYIAGDQLVRVFGSDGTKKSEFAVQGKPRCLAVDASGVVYVGVGDHVEVFAPDSRLQAEWPAPGKGSFVTSIALAPDAVWVADAGRRLVDHYDRTGRFVGSIGKRDDARKIPGLLTPSPHLDVAIASGGLIVVTNPGRHVVETYTAQGELKGSWGRASNDLDGFCGCCNPTDIAVLPDGKIATSEKGLPRVKVYTPAGALESLVAEPPGISSAAVGIDLAADAKGRLWVLDPVAKVVKVYGR